MAVSAAAALSLPVLAGFLWQNAESRVAMVQNLELAQQELDDAIEKRRAAEADTAGQQSLAAAKRTEAEHLTASARHIRYAADEQLARAAWENDNLPRVRALLERYRGADAADLCRFEWGYRLRKCACR